MRSVELTSGRRRSIRIEESNQEGKAHDNPVAHNQVKLHLAVDLLAVGLRAVFTGCLDVQVQCFGLFMNIIIVDKVIALKQSDAHTHLVNGYVSLHSPFVYLRASHTIGQNRS